MHDPRSVSKVAGNTEQGSASDLFQPLEKKIEKYLKNMSGVRICLVMKKALKLFTNAVLIKSYQGHHQSSPNIDENNLI